MGSTLSWAWILDSFRRKKPAEHKNHCTLLPDCGCSVTSCLRLLLPDLSTMMDSALELLTETNSSFLKLVCMAFYHKLRHIHCILQKVMGVEG